MQDGLIGWRAKHAQARGVSVFDERFGVADPRKKRVVIMKWPGEETGSVANKICKTWNINCKLLCLCRKEPIKLKCRVTNQYRYSPLLISQVDQE